MSPLDYFVNHALKKFIRDKNCTNRAEAERFIIQWLEDDQNQAEIQKAILGSCPRGGFKSRWRCLWERGGDEIQSITRRVRFTIIYLSFRLCTVRVPVGTNWSVIFKICLVLV